MFLRLFSSYEGKCGRVLVFKERNEIVLIDFLAEILPSLGVMVVNLLFHGLCCLFCTGLQRPGERGDYGLWWVVRGSGRDRRI